MSNGKKIKKPYAVAAPMFERSERRNLFGPPPKRDLQKRGLSFLQPGKNIKWKHRACLARNGTHKLQSA